MRNMIILFAALVCALVLQVTPVLAEEPAYPSYLLKAQSLVQKAASAAAELKAVNDDVLIAQNFIRNAEGEFKKNLSWTGKLEPAAEPTVHYFSSMAELQASFVLARVGKTRQEKELKNTEAKIAAVKAKIKVFDDKNDELLAMKKGVTELNAELLALKAEKEQLATKLATLEGSLSSVSGTLTQSQQKCDLLSSESSRCTNSLVSAEKKIAELSIELEQTRLAAKAERDTSAADLLGLKKEISALAAAKGLSESQSKEQIKALNRQKEFVSKVAQLGGVVKPGSENLTVVFPRALLLKTPKNDKMSVDGEKLAASLAALLQAYPEYRIKLKVHGFGTPAKNEDAAATDRMARMIREAVLGKGTFEPNRVEALGSGTAEPVAPRKNVEGNRRVELTFVKQ